MKSLIKYSTLLFTIVVMLMISACNTHNYNEMEVYCYKINSIVKDIDFHTAKVKDKKIIFYDDKNIQIKEVPFEDYEKNYYLQ